MGFGEEVPLVKHDRGRAGRLHRELGDPQVLGGDAFGRVAHHERHVRALGRTAGAQRGVVLHGVRHLRLPAHPGGVDQGHAAALHAQRRVDRVAGRACELRHDHAFLTQEAVDQRGLADVRAADHRQAQCVPVGLELGGGQQLHDPVEQVARAEALRGRDRQRLAEAEAVKLGRLGQLRDTVALVGRHEARQRRAAQQVRELLVARAHPRARVDHQHRHLRLSEACARLLADRAGQRVLVVEVHPAGVDQLEAPPVPLALHLVAVARHPRALVHDRLTRAAQAVDERGLAHVGVANDGDLQHRGSRGGLIGPV